MSETQYRCKLYRNDYELPQLAQGEVALCFYLFAVVPVTDDIKSLKVRNIPLRATSFDAASDFGY